MDELEEETPHRCTTMVYYAWKIFTCLFTHVMLVTMVVTYCILGAMTFESLESDNEIAVKKNVTYMRNNVTEDLWKLTRELPVLHFENWTNSVTSRLKIFENDLIVSMKKGGWDGSEDDTVRQWTFAGALFYSIIVITTIGYGHIAPKTQIGKVTTIFYAILGIPLMLLCLSNIGDIMAHSFRFLYWRICCYACTRTPKKPHNMYRRGRSFRSTVRSHSGGRSSGRSRTASLKRWGRGPYNQGSQRSADSALALSETLTHSYSDTECRYYDEPDRELSMIGPNTRSYKRQSPYHSPKNLPQSVQEVRSVMAAPPVLFNKYALDREETSFGQPWNVCNPEEEEEPQQQHKQQQPQDQQKERQSQDQKQSQTNRSETPNEKRRSQHSTISKQNSRTYLTPPLTSSANTSTRSRRFQEMSIQNPSPRIMSPLGFTVHRQTYTRRHHEMDFYSDYDYYDYCDDNTPSQIKPVPIWLCVFLVVSYIIGGAFLFSGWEGWGFPDSAYFCFITLTTIGFGDFVPAKRVNKNQNAEVSIALCSLYLLFGIALLAMSFNLVQEEVISNVKRIACHLGIIKDDDEDED
ncbi:potassium two pore domain channel subfamily K member galene isoform X2 [Lycorma delicatula]|uniref:potassium two pore domain channel subfamily K member galene isoform X2 n=1 Tax=Lycorma delicatula TaxID=130591 RepID=UPI003F512C65